MGRHDGARAGGDRRAERRQLHLPQLVERRRDDGEAEVRVDRRRAVAREVLGAGGDSALLETAHERADVTRDERWIRPERPHADDRVERIRVDVGDRRQIVGDAGGTELIGQGARDARSQLDVVHRAERERAGDRASASKPPGG